MFPPYCPLLRVRCSVVDQFRQHRLLGGVSQIVFSTKSAGAQGEKIEKETEIRENLTTRIEAESEKEGLK